MSFGFSVGDFISAIQVVHSLYRVLSESTGSSLEYQQIIFELDCTHRIFIQLQDLCTTNQLSQACISGIGVIVTSSVKLIEPFLRRIEKYRNSLSARRTASQATVVWRKIGWSIHKPGELVALKDSLRSNQINIMLLVVTATHHELTVDRFGYGQAVIRKLSQKEDFTEVKVFHTITSPPLDKQQLDPTYTVCKYPETFFRVGQVFAIIDDWDMFYQNTETLYPLPISHSDMEYSRYAGLSIIRRFAVVQEGVHGALCIAIHTYSNQGCIYEPDQDLHAIIHTTSEPPTTLTREIVVYRPNTPYVGEFIERDESGMIARPVRMTVDHVSLSLHPASRLHFGRVYRIEHDVRVKSLGVIHIDSISDFIKCYKSVQEHVQALSKVRKVVEKAANKLISGSYHFGHPSEQRQPSGEPKEDTTRNQAKAMAELKALCGTNDAVLFVTAKYDSDSHRLNGLDEHPSRLRFKKGDRIKVLNNAVAATDPTALNGTSASNQVAMSNQRTVLDESTISPGLTASNDLATPDATWWTGELNGRQGEFPWWYCEVEDVST